MTDIQLNAKVSIIIPDIKEVTPENTEEVVKTAIAKPEYIENLLSYFEETFNPELYKITDINDAEQIKKAENANRILRTARNRSVDICKASREELNKKLKESTTLQNSITDRISALEDPIKAELDRVKEEKAALLKAEEAEKKLPLRKTILANVGIVAEDAQIKDLSDEDFLAFVNAETQKIADARAQKEAQEKAEKEAEENKKRIEAETLAREKKNIRISKLTVLGFKFSEAEQAYTCTIWEYKNTVTVIDLDCSDEEFSGMITFLEKEIHDAYQKKADADAQAAAQKKIDEANRIKAKEEADAKAKAEAIAKAEKEKADALPDKQKLLDFVQSMTLRLPLPEVKTEQAKKIADYARQLISVSQQKLTEQINKL